MGATGVGFLLIWLLDTLLRFNGGVSSLRGIGERPLVGPFLYISDTILNTSSIFFNFSSNIFSFFVTVFWFTIPLVHYFNNHRCNTTTGFLCPLPFHRIYSLPSIPLPLGISRNSRCCTTTGFLCLLLFQLVYYLPFSFLVIYPSNM